MGKLSKLFKRQKELEKQGEVLHSSVDVKIVPDTYQIIVSIAKDGKSASMTQLITDEHLTVFQLGQGLQMVRDQLIQDFGIEKYKQEQIANYKQSQIQKESSGANPPS